jgi:sigma-B regulation protein RsbU (phosphoserine phosphatase)
MGERSCRTSLYCCVRHALAAAVLLLSLVAAGPNARAQNANAIFDASNLREPADLSMNWRVYPGDNPTFAGPAFDDSQWKLFDPRAPISYLVGNTYPEIIWYRLRVKVSPDQKGLALREMMISRAFEIYVNGERIIASGQVAPFVPYTMNSRILARIPDRLVSSGELVIAARVHISKIEWLSGQNPGLFANNLTIGQEHTLYLDNWLNIIGQNAMDWLDRFLLIGVGVVALVLFAAQRRQIEYLWIFAVGMLTLAESPVTLISTFHDVPMTWAAVECICRLFSPYIWALLYFSFVHQRIGLRWRIFLIFAGVANFYSGIATILFPAPLSLQLIGNLPFVILLSVIIPIVLAVHLRRGNREAGILLIPVILFSLFIYAQVALSTMFEFPASREAAIRGINLINRYPAGPFAVSLDHVSGILSSLSLAVIMLLRSTTVSRRQAQLEGELAAAQQVQQVLLPEQIEPVPGFAVETVYQPAQQVGGDFFQILPAGEGGLLVVVGDVAGKGLPAAMLVSVLVGAIRATADRTNNPEDILASLNDRLVGRGGGGFSTALAAHIHSNGKVTVANAGHLSPYLDGREVELPGALPLGVMIGGAYDTTEFYLAPGSRLTFYSDGVIEAQNPRGELFGFDRAKEISTQPAAAIAEAAKQFGQEDDITVVTITRAAAIATAA